MQKVKLDRIDKQILKDLQEDGRITNVNLANKAGIFNVSSLDRRLLEGISLKVAKQNLHP